MKKTSILIATAMLALTAPVNALENQYEIIVSADLESIELFVEGAAALVNTVDSESLPLLSNDEKSPAAVLVQFGGAGLSTDQDAWLFGARPLADIRGALKSNVTKHYRLAYEVGWRRSKIT